MRQIKRISFLIYSCLLLAAGFYGHIKYVEWFYPGSLHMEEVSFRKGDETAQAAAAPAKITADTELVILELNLTSGETTQINEKVPAKYVGLDRAAFVRCMEDEAAACALSERRKGLISIEVQSFSPQRIVIQKSYRKQEEADAASFYLVLQDNMVVIYEADRSTLYMKTFIDGRTLPQPIRDELVYGMVMEGVSGLEAFVAQYSQVPASE